MKTFDPFQTFFRQTKNKAQAVVTGGNNNTPLTAPQESVDLDVQKKNIFQNNVLYFQKYKDLEEKVSHLEKLNSFLVSQILQTFKPAKDRSASQKIEKVSKASENIRKKSLKFEDDRSLNKTFQMFNIFKGMLDTGGAALAKISSLYFPPTFDFESALYQKNHLQLLNVVLKTSINSVISLKDQLARQGKGIAKKEIANQQNEEVANISLMIANHGKTAKDQLSFNSGGSALGHESANKEQPQAGSSYKKQFFREALSEGLSFSHNKAGNNDEPMFSESFLNMTEIKNNILQPFQIGLQAVAKQDYGTQVREEDWSSSRKSSEAQDSNSKDHFSII